MHENSPVQYYKRFNSIEPGPSSEASSSSASYKISGTSLITYQARAGTTIFATVSKRSMQQFTLPHL
jgi:hypothetical protein